MVFGHCSLAIDHDTVLQIEGPGDKPLTEDFESYRDRYGKGKNEWIKSIDVHTLTLDQKQLNGQRIIMRTVIANILLHST